MVSTHNRKCCFQVQVESIQANKLQVKFPILMLFVATIVHTLDALHMSQKEGNMHGSLLFSGMYL